MKFSTVDVSEDQKGNVIETSVSMFSQMYHFVAFGLKKPRVQYDKGMLIISIDVDAGSKKLGIINKGKNDANVHKHYSETFVGDIEERALPMLIKAFNDVEVPVTFAVRGQLTEIDNQMELFFNSPVKHDIGAHGYYHKNFQMLTRNEAEEELRLIACGLRKFGVTPNSFIFPRNAVRHLDLLEQFGYKCYRDDGNFRSDGMFIEKKGKLYNIQPSLYLSPCLNSVILQKIVDVAVVKKAPLHFWFHPWNFGTTDTQIKKYMESVFLPFLRYAKNKEKKGMLTFETMYSASLKAESFLSIPNIAHI